MRPSVIPAPAHPNLPTVRSGRWLVEDERGSVVDFHLAFQIPCPGCGGVIRPRRLDRDAAGKRVVLWACLVAGCEYRDGDEF